MTADPSTVLKKAAEIQRRIEGACERSQRDPAGIQIVAASKGVSLQAMQAALAAGIERFGENRVQEAAGHIGELGIEASKATWHMIGHLQTNKTQAALDLFAMIQSVDSLRLAQGLSRRATKEIPVLLEVNAAKETSKYGFIPEDLDVAVPAIQALPNLKLSGFMTMAPLGENQEQARPVFRELCELAKQHGLAELSMGMSDDFEVAVEEGATMVRLGRALFGARTG